jgi:pSer/pThr/pTyr-binding forkhead associated (FHA) protein
MSDSDKSPLEKAEEMVRRLLERMGSAIDDRVGEKRLGARRITELSSLLEAAIESNLRIEEGSPTRIAPNQFRLLLTYEERSELGAAYVAALGRELKLVAAEIIADRRYRTLGPISLDVVSDVFSKSSSVKAGFVAETGPDSAPEGETASVLELELAPGQTPFRPVLVSGAGPVYIGRAAGSAVRIDDASVSRVHCSLALRSTGEVVLCDLGSSNGTRVNGRIVSQGEARLLAAGDTITVGDVDLKVSSIQARR